MTRYFSFLDGSTPQGSETILGIEQNGSEFGVGITSVVQMENLSVLNSIGIGTTIPEFTLDVRGSISCSEDIIATGIITANSFSGEVSYANVSGIATYATTAGISTYANVSGIATYATTAGISTYATTAGIATYTTTAGISTVSQGLTGSPNIITGITTVGLGTTSAPSNSQLTFELISNTNLRIKVRGTDGMLRSANITLA